MPLASKPASAILICAKRPVCLAGELPMPEAKIAAFLVALVVLAGLFVLYYVRLKRAVKQKLAAREQVPALEFGARYYSDPRKAEIGSFIVVKLQQLTGYDFTGVVPSDRFVTDLHLHELDSLATVEIITEIESRFRITISDDEALHVQSFGDFVDLVFSKTLRTTPTQAYSLAQPMPASDLERSTSSVISSAVRVSSDRALSPAHNRSAHAPCTDE